MCDAGRVGSHSAAYDPVVATTRRDIDSGDLEHKVTFGEKKGSSNITIMYVCIYVMPLPPNVDKRAKVDAPPICSAKATSKSHVASSFVPHTVVRPVAL